MKEPFQQLNGDASKSAKKLEDTKKIIRSLLLSTKYGLTVNELCSEYDLIACGELPFRELGYSNPMDFIRSMRDVVRTSYQPGGACLLRGIADESTAHISALVRGQKSTGSRNTKLHKPVQVPKKKAPPQQPRRHVSHFIQSNIYDFMQKYQNGIAFDQFDDTYFRRYAKRLNPQLQGYTSIRGLLEACTDIVRLEDTSKGTYVYPVKTSGAHNRFSMKVVPYMSTTSQFLDDNKFVNSNRTKPKIEVPEALKKEILSVLLKRENGVFAARFPFEYKAMYKKELNVQSVGFTSVVELMAEIPDIAKVTRPTEKGDFILTVSETKAPISARKKEETVDYTTKSPGSIGDHIEICVSVIVNPTLFYVQLCNGLDDLYDLMDAMTNFYAANYKDFHLPPQSIVEDQACAAIYEEQWYRALIAEVISDTQVKVYYVDYGNDANVESSTLCILKQEYSKLPCQAFKAKMNDVEPSVEDEFSAEAVQHFFDLTCDQELGAVIVENEPFLCLDIYDKDNNNISKIFNEQPDYFEEDEKAALVHPLDEQCYPDPYNNISEQPVKLRTQSPSFSYFNNVSSSELVKVVNISDTCRLHLLRYENTPYVLSSEISALFWDTDILRQMLREHKPLFDALSNHQIQGTLDGKVKDIESIYELTALPKICSFFEPIHSDTKLVVLKEIKFWSQCVFDEQYWGGCCDEEMTEVMLLSLHAKYFMKKRLYQLIFIYEHTAHTVVE